MLDNQSAWNSHWYQLLRIHPKAKQPPIFAATKFGFWRSGWQLSWKHARFPNMQDRYAAAEFSGTYASWPGSLAWALHCSPAYRMIIVHIKYVGPERPISLLDEARRGDFRFFNGFMLCIFPAAAVCSFMNAISLECSHGKCENVGHWYRRVCLFQEQVDNNIWRSSNAWGPCLSCLGL